MKLFYLSWILRKVFANSPIAEFSSPIQSGNGWNCTLTDKINWQVYVCRFEPIETEKVVIPDTINGLLKAMEGK